MQGSGFEDLGFRILALVFMVLVFRVQGLGLQDSVIGLLVISGLVSKRGACFGLKFLKFMDLKPHTLNPKP